MLNHGMGGHEVASGGAAEPSPLNQTWFAHRLTSKDGPTVLASTFAHDATDRHVDSALPLPLRFPLPWQTADSADWVPAVDVTAHYRTERGAREEGSAAST